MHAGRGGGDRRDIVDALRGLQDGMDQDRLGDRVPRLQLGEKLVEVVDVPRALDLGQHDHVELVADRSHDLDACRREAHGELSALTRVHRPVAPKSLALAMAMKPARAAVLASAGIASSRLPSTTSTCAISSGTLARTFSICGGTKWIMRSSLTGRSRSGAGAPIASGLKKLRGSFMAVPIFRFQARRPASPYGTGNA